MLTHPSPSISSPRTIASTDVHAAYKDLGHGAPAHDAGERLLDLLAVGERIQLNHLGVHVELLEQTLDLCAV